MQSIKSRLYGQGSNGTAFKLGEISGTEDGPQTDWSEELWASLTEKGGPFILLKMGQYDSKYSARNLSPNNSQRAAGSKGEFIDESEARDWLEDNGGTPEDLDDFITAYELIAGLN